MQPDDDANDPAQDRLLKVYRELPHTRKTWFMPRVELCFAYTGQRAPMVQFSFTPTRYRNLAYRREVLAEACRSIQRL